jgi:hypothetical protein
MRLSKRRMYAARLITLVLGIVLALVAWAVVDWAVVDWEAML